jgi:hypothetical protein
MASKSNTNNSSSSKQSDQPGAYSTDERGVRILKQDTDDINKDNISTRGIAPYCEEGMQGRDHIAGYKSLDHRHHSTQRLHGNSNA